MLTDEYIVVALYSAGVQQNKHTLEAYRLGVEQERARAAEVCREIAATARNPDSVDPTRQSKAWDDAWDTCDTTAEQCATKIECDGKP